MDPIQDQGKNRGVESNHGQKDREKVGTQTRSRNGDDVETQSEQIRYENADRIYE
jgi:hypothetical protein